MVADLLNEQQTTKENPVQSGQQDQFQWHHSRNFRSVTPILARSSPFVLKWKEHREIRGPNL